MIVDLGLVRRLESSATAATVALADEIARTDPASGAATASFHGGALVATGLGRYVNRALGITLDDLTDGDLDVVESFYADRQLVPTVEVSSWASNATLAAFGRRSFGPEWFRAMFAAEPDVLSIAPVRGVTIEGVTDDLAPVWLDALADGNGIETASARAVSDQFGSSSRATVGDHAFVAMLDGEVAGCGSVHVVDGVAWLGAAATVPGLRGRGVQTALVRHRVEVAKAAGCDLVALTALPAGASARNLLRLGVRMVQTQVVLSKRPSVDG